MQVKEMYKVIPNISHICRSFSLNWRTVSKYLAMKDIRSIYPKKWDIKLKGYIERK